MTNPRDLVQLRALYQSGLLSEDEYTEARRRLLGYKVKRGRAVPPASAAVRPAAPSAASRPVARDVPPTGERRSLNASAQPKSRGSPPRNPNSDLPLIFALAALALVAMGATIWFLMG
jgi:hypothetical protein